MITTTVELAELTLATPIGELWLCATTGGLLHIAFPGESRANPTRQHQDKVAHLPPAEEHQELTSAEAIVNLAAAQLHDYFTGRRRQFDLPLSVPGTPFQQLVWEALQQIPYGTTCSYGEMARRLGRPQAARAIGSANATNLLPPIIPCHRLLGSNGQLTGYGGGLEVKRWLIDFERENLLAGTTVGVT